MKLLYLYNIKTYVDLLIKWNRRINLVGTSDPRVIMDEHVYDSLKLLPYIENIKRGRILDVGSGAGFPGVPLKIARPDLHVVLCESIRKKAAFLREAIRQLRLNDVSVLNQRLTTGMDIGSFDAIVSRGTMKVIEILKLCHEYLNTNGRILLLKGMDVDEEVSMAADFAKTIGLCVECIPYKLPVSGKRRSIVMAIKS